LAQQLSSAGPVERHKAAPCGARGSLMQYCSSSLDRAEDVFDVIFGGVLLFLLCRRRDINSE
jgi:hypothetical protein